MLKPAYGFAVRLTRNEADAEDLLQEAAARACRAFHQFQPGTNFRAWFFKILANCFYAKLRTERHRGEHVHIEDTPPLYLFMRTAEAGLHERDTDPATWLVNRLSRDQIEKALSELPTEYRIVATLYLVEDLKYEEISDVLNIPIGTVRSRMHRGRRILQKKLWDVAVDHGLVPKMDDH